MNILLPMAGGSTLFKKSDFPFPKPLIEICDVPMIQLVVENLMAIESEKGFFLLFKSQIV